MNDLTPTVKFLLLLALLIIAIIVIVNLLDGDGDGAEVGAQIATVLRG